LAQTDAPVDDAHFKAQVCRNCGAARGTPHCGACGQQAAARFGAQDVWLEFWQSRRWFEMPLLRAALRLLRAPGLVAREYVLGARKRHVHPLKLLLFAVALLVLLLIITLEYPLIMEKYGDPDWGAVLTGYVGTLLAGLAFLAISLFASSLTRNQIAAAIIGAFMLLFFWLIGWLSMSVNESVGAVAKHISIFENFQDFEKGIIDSKPVVYFLSLMGFFLFLTVRSLENKRTI